MKRLKEEKEERVEKVKVPGVTYYNYLKGKEEFDKSKENLEKQEEEARKNADKNETSFVALLKKAIKDSGLDLEMQLKESLGVYEYNIKDRKELSKVLECLSKANIKANIKRGVKEGYRYLLQVKNLTEAKGNVIPRDWKKITFKLLKDTNAGKPEDTFVVEHDEFDRPIATNQRTGNKYQVNWQMLREPEFVEILNVEKKVTEAKEFDKESNKKGLRSTKIKEVKPVREESLKESIDLEALEAYANMEEGDNITVTADLLAVLEKALEMAKQYGVKESCKGKKCKKQLKETWAGDDVIDDITERAQMMYDDGNYGDISDCVTQAIDEGLIYTKDIYSLLEHYGSISDSEIIESFFDDLWSDVYNGVEEHEEEDEDDEDEDIDESKKQECKKKVLEALKNRTSKKACKEECKEECEKQLKESNGYGKEYYEVEEKDYYEDMLKDFSWEDEVEYQFPPLTKEDLKKIFKYDLEVLGKLKGDDQEEKDVLVAGKLEDVINYADKELGYALHPDFLYHRGDFDTEDLLECNVKEEIEPVTKEEGIREDKEEKFVTVFGPNGEAKDFESSEEAEEWAKERWGEGNYTIESPFEESLKESKLNEILVTELQRYVDKVKEELPDAVKETEEKLEASTSKAEDFASLSVFWNKVMDHAFDSWEDQDIHVLVDDAEAMMPMPESVHKQFVNLLFEDKIKNINVLYDLDIYDDLLTTGDVGLDDGEYEKLYDELVNNVYFEETEEDKEYEPSADDDIEYNGEFEREDTEEEPAEEKPAEEKSKVDAEKELEIKKVLEDRNTFEFESGDYCYIGYEDGKLFAGSATNAGIMREVEIDYDFDESVDANLDRLYNAVVEKHPEYLDF